MLTLKPDVRLNIINNETILSGISIMIYTPAHDKLVDRNIFTKMINAFINIKKIYHTIFEQIM